MEVENNVLHSDPRLLLKLAQYKMPFGKYKDCFSGNAPAQKKTPYLLRSHSNKQGGDSSAPPALSYFGFGLWGGWEHINGAGKKRQQATMQNLRVYIYISCFQSTPWSMSIVLSQARAQGYLQYGPPPFHPTVAESFPAAHYPEYLGSPQECAQCHYPRSG